MKTNDLFIKGEEELYPLINAYFKFLGANNVSKFEFYNTDVQYYISDDNTIKIAKLNDKDPRNKNILDVPFYIRGTKNTQEIFNKLGIVNDGRFDCSYSNYIYYIENDNLHDKNRKTVNGILTDSILGKFIKDNWFDATDVLTEILINKKPKSIEEFNKLYTTEYYDLENEAELLTKLLKISFIYNNDKYPDWTEDTVKYSIKCGRGKLCIINNQNFSSCIAFDKREYAEEYLKVFEKDLEKVKYWL